MPQDAARLALILRARAVLFAQAMCWEGVLVAARLPCGAPLVRVKVRLRARLCVAHVGAGLRVGVGVRVCVRMSCMIGCVWVALCRLRPGDTYDGGARLASILPRGGCVCVCVRARGCVFACVAACA